MARGGRKRSYVYHSSKSRSDRSSNPNFFGGAKAGKDSDQADHEVATPDDSQQGDPSDQDDYGNNHDDGYGDDIGMDQTRSVVDIGDDGRHIESEEESSSESSSSDDESNAPGNNGSGVIDEGLSSDIAALFLDNADARPEPSMNEILAGNDDDYNKQFPYWEPDDENEENEREMPEPRYDDVEEVPICPTQTLRNFFLDRHKTYLARTAATGLDIVARGNDLFRQFQNSTLPDDDGKPIHDGSSMSKGDWAREYMQRCSDINPKPPIGGVTGLLQFLQRTLPDGVVNFPLEAGTEGKPLKASVYSYCIEHIYKSYIEFQVCARGCHVFGEAGQNLDQIVCPLCQSPRYTSLASLVPESTIHYRPLIPLIRCLLEKEMFVQAMLHKRLKAVDPDVIHDLLDGAHIKKHVAEMNAKFNEHCAKTPSDSPLTEISFVLGQFLDGVQVHSTITSKFYPMLISFNNLPPSMRGTLSVGTFVIALDTHNTAQTRRFLLERCLLPELQKLEQGFLAVTATRACFVQARLLVHCFDTKEMESMFHVQASTAKAPCPLCGRCNGVYRNLLKKCFYCSALCMLPKNHYMRSLSQSGLDYPSGYFEEKENPKFFGESRHNETVCKAHKAEKHKDKDHSLSLVDHIQLLRVHDIDVETKEDKQPFEMDVREIKAILRSMPTFDKLTAKDVFNDIDHMKKIFEFCNFPFADLRYIPYGRVEHDVYLSRAMAFYKKWDVRRRSTTEVEPVEGCSGASFMVMLAYFSFCSQVCWEGFHALSGAGKNAHHNIMGKRKYSHGWAQRTWCHFHRINVNPDVKPPWVMSQKMQDFFDAFVECMRIPVGSSDHWQVNLPFKRQGFLKGIGRIQLIAYVLPVVLSMEKNGFVKNYPPGIKSYLAVAGKVFTELLSPVFTVESIKKLQDKVIEFVASHAGIFPSSESTFLVHELVDLPSFIAEYGPLRCWWALYGERAMSKIKRCVPTGGQSYQKTTFQKYIVQEESDTNSFYSTFDNLVDDKDFVQVVKGVSNDGKTPTHTIYSKLFCCRLYHPYTFKQMEYLNKQETAIYQYEQLLESMIMEIEDTFLKTPDGLKHALRASSFYRVYYFFCKHLRATFTAFRQDTCTAFVRWLLSSHCVQTSLAQHELTLRIEGQEQKDLDKGCIFDDFLKIIEEVRMLEVELYRNAVVQGVRMNSRGWYCAEQEVDTVTVGQPTNPLNVLRDHWHCKQHYSSWSIVTPAVHPKNEHLLSRTHRQILKLYNKWAEAEVVTTQHIERETYYAQINIFLVLRLASDSFLNRQVFASVTCRCSVNKQPNQMSCNDAESLLPRTSYVPIKDIKGIRLGVVGFDARGRLFPSRVKEFRNDKVYSRANTTAVDYLMFCQLDGVNDPLHDFVRRETFLVGEGVDPAILEMQVNKGLYEWRPI